MKRMYQIHSRVIQFALLDLTNAHNRTKINQIVFFIFFFPSRMSMMAYFSVSVLDAGCCSVKLS